VSTPSGGERGLRRRFGRSTTAIRNVAASYAGTAAEGLVFLLITPFLVRELGLAQYGLWSLAVVSVDWTQLFDLGLREAVMKFAAAHQARAELPGLRRVAESAMFVYALIGAAVFVALALFCVVALPWLVDSPETLGQARAVILILGLSAAVSFPAGLAGTLLEGLSRFELLNLIRAGHAALRLALVVLALQFDLGVVGVAAAELLARLGLHATRWFFLLRLYPDLAPRPMPHRVDLSRLLEFGLWNAIRQGSDVAMARMYEPLLAMFAGLSSVGAFYAGRRLASMPGEAIVPLAGVLFPLSSEMDAGERKEALREVLFKTTKFAAAVSLPLALILAFGAKPIQTNWLGNRAPEAEAVMRVFAIGFLFVAAVMPSESILLGLGRVRLLAIAGFAHVVITIAAGIPLTKLWGAPGLAAGSLIAVLTTQFLVYGPAAARHCGVNPWRFFAKAILPTWIAGAPVAVMMFLAGGRIARGGMAALATWGGGAVVVYLAIFWRVGLDVEERAFLRRHVRRLILDPAEIGERNGLS
jgi:O-antigen/teichoic acid export membrane protein